MLPVTFSADEVEYGEIRLQDVSAGLEESGAFRFGFGAWSGPGATWLGAGVDLSGHLEELHSADGESRLSARLLFLGLEARLAGSARDDGYRIELGLDDQLVATLQDLRGAPPQLAWAKGGRFDATLTAASKGAGRPELGLALRVRDLGFDSPDGQFAGEGLAFTLDARSGGGAQDSVLLRSRMLAGEVLIGDFYSDLGAAGLSFETTAYRAGDGVVLAPLNIEDSGGLSASATLAWAVAGTGPGFSLQVNRLALSFPAAYRQYLESVAAAATLDGLEVTGEILWSGEWAAGEFQSGNLEVRDLSVVDVQRGRFAATGVQGTLRPGDYGFDSRLSWRGLILGRVNLGAGSASLDAEPGTVALAQPVRLDVLGGQVDLERLRVVLPGAGTDAARDPDVLLRARITDVDVQQLTRAFEWPEFAGRVSGEIPDVALDDGVLELDGEIRLNIFDGLVAMRNLRIERPFGVLPSLAADLDIQSLDLEQLTGTFSFGRISGPLDGYVRDLRMLDWKPVAFDAWLGTPEGQTRSNDISRQAVNRLTSIGGGSATAALTSPLLRAFSNFSYRRLGLGCVLRNNVCALRGLSDDTQSVLILEGAGIPKITIRAFNRNLDWPQMIANLLAVSAGESIQVGGAVPE